MRPDSQQEFSADNPAPWIELAAGSSPILLIAPHGGRAGPASRTRPNPKVNDLHTAEITRRLADLLSASAIVNAAMDRNQLDCNRLGQLLEAAPWLVELISRTVANLAAVHGHVTVLVIHGWNIIEPRVDFGLGVRLRDGKLVPAGSAHVSARDEFVNQTVATLADRLRDGGITPSFGYRYPAGGFHNLLQMFTPRHLESPYPALRELAAIASRGMIDALQLELSVAVRMPGRLRAHALEAIAAAFSDNSHTRRATAAAIPVIRTHKQTAKAATTHADRSGPTRVGLEFYDPEAGVGGMASFDLGPGAIGARIMMLLDRRRVALFTSEGVVRRDGGRIALGPLALESAGNELKFRFAGPAVIVPDATAYLSIERALASGALDDAVEVSAQIDLGIRFDLETLLAGDPAGSGRADSASAFGRLAGTITIGGSERRLAAVARAGLSFSGLGAARFVSRRMVWASFPENPSLSVMEARAIANEDRSTHNTARIFGATGWAPCELADFDLDTRSADSPPDRIAANVAVDGQTPMPLIGKVFSFVPLSRPGPNQTRIYTSLGFADFQLGESRGAGMFEYSRRVQTHAPSNETDDD